MSLYPIPDNLPDLTRELVSLRKKPGTEARFKAYPAMLERFRELLEACDDIATLRAVIELDAGYHLLAGYRQRVLEKWLMLERTPEVLRLMAVQLEFFGDVDEWGAADTHTEKTILALEAEAAALEKAAANRSQPSL